jgi:hypothetical protein
MFAAMRRASIKSQPLGDVSIGFVLTSIDIGKRLSVGVHDLEAAV